MPDRLRVNRAHSAPPVGQGLGIVGFRRPPGFGPDSGAPPRPEEDALVGSEASHAWVAAWCPSLGWIEVDPTDDLVPADGHLVLAWGATTTT